jgi:nitroreductase
MEMPADNQYPIHDLLRFRWSPRAFSAQAVEAEKLLSLFEAARWSPSGGNLQPWAFIIATQEDAQAHSRFVDILNEGNQVWAKNAPVLILTVARRERREGQPNHWAMYDLGQAVAHLTVQASAVGLSLRQMGGFNQEKAREMFELPDGYDPVTAIALGYQGSQTDLPEELRTREMGGRSRKPLAEFVFAGRWNEPIQVGLEVGESALG